MNEFMGWVKIYRSIINDDVWNNGEPKDSFSAFQYLIIMANHKNNSVYGRRVNRGQLWTSINRLALAWNRDKRTVKRMISNLTADGKIICEASNKGVLITVVNYNKYQGETPKNNNDVVVSTTTNTTNSTTAHTTTNATADTTQTRSIKNEYKEI